ncbi:hypothetical protein TPHV1_90079 [Treponema phagedenis]|uniref:Uncharacterized protein n=1 Tax=Treponema phagedenis TaxID=162 RepID=A0A0B7H2I1_TREPH|nr:hypothetical protein TPHV1_90079 [Treponema phagedenis]
MKKALSYSNLFVTLNGAYFLEYSRLLQLFKALKNGYSKKTINRF